MRTNLTPEECMKVLQSEHYGHLGCTDGKEPYVLPTTYIYKDKTIYSHTHEGKKIEMMRANPRVCLQVERVFTGFAWESVLCWGTFEEVTDAKEKHDIDLLLAKQHGAIMHETKKAPVSPFLKDINTDSRHQDKASVVYRITIDRMTGIAEKP